MHQHDSLLNLAQLKAELLAQHADLRLTQDEAHDLSFASSRVSGSFALELWVHHLQSSGLSARRPAADEDLAQLPVCERLHLWVTVRDAAGAYVHHQVLCDAQGLHALLQAWREPMAPTPDGLRMAAATAPVARKSATATTAPETPTPVCDASALRAWDEVLASPLLADMAPADVDQLRADLARVDPQQLARHWPRDARGRLAAKTTALLAACGPPVTLNQRQPCLLISSAGVRDMPCWQLQLSRELRENQRLQWDATPWLWARDATPPAEPPHAAQARALIAQGRIDEACALCDVSLGESLRRLACPCRALTASTPTGWTSCTPPCASWRPGLWPVAWRAFSSGWPPPSASRHSPAAGRASCCGSRASAASRAWVWACARARMVARSWM